MGLQGEQGPQGPQGEPGLQGERGDPGLSDVTVSDSLTGTRQAADGVAASEWALAQVNEKAEGAQETAEGAQAAADEAKAAADEAKAAVAMVRVTCGTGEILASRGAIRSVTKTGTGLFTIAHDVSSPFAIAIPSATTAGSAPRSVTISSNGNNVRTYDASGALVDAGYFIAIYYSA